ncbi:MAG: DUF5686 and carboxypeptidase regulatory-like domain-containing protein [Crocinitomicaceae bacterium]|nr:DUF5686 and carboxypeptidase regulatory-like domain-containing protein [Crocinitomicaceae bacterium]
MLKKSFVLFTFLFSLSALGQSINGYVLDSDNNPIPYAKVYVKNFTNIGGITDEDGKYYFGVDYGSYEVVYSSVGFEEQTHTVVVDKLEPTEHNVYLKNNTELNTVEIKTKKRNIGWEIVQNVIAHKRDLVKQFENYSVDVYIKGVETFEYKEKKKKEDDSGEPDDLFEKQKEEIQNKINGDGNRLNMIEISLTKHFEYPNNVKEIRNGVEKIGRPDQIYFQTTVNGEFNFYKNLLNKPDLHRGPIMSPLHPSGILSYKYKLKELNVVEGDTIYKIQIDSRNVGTTTMEGFLWVKKNDWVLTKVDLSMRKGNLKVYDDFRIIQEYEQLDSFWVVRNQIFEYSTKYGKETVKGTTVVNYSNYEINKTFPEKFFSNEIGLTVDEAYERDSTFWDENRPIPLTVEEQRKKFVQDSLTAIYTSEKYLDSVDAVFNKITFLKVAWFGVEHRDREKKTQWYLSSITDLVEPFEPAGVRIGPGFDFFKKFENEQWFDVSGDITVGFNNWDLRGRLGFYHRYAPKKFGSYGWQVGKWARQINPWDAFFSGLQGSNYYENRNINLWHNIELFNGFFIYTSFTLDNRRPFDSDYNFDSWMFEVLENTPPTQFDPYNAFRHIVGISYTPFQKYRSEPNRKVIIGSKWPEFSLYWEKGYDGPFSSIVDFDYVSLTVDHSVQVGLWGLSNYRIRTGKFFNQDSVFRIDKKFFMKANTDPLFKWLFIPPQWAFQNLDSSYETQDFYFELHYIHHFNGSIVNKIPFMKKTGIQALAGGGALFLPEHNNYFYTEAFLGLERIFKFARQRLRIGAYVIFSWNSNSLVLPDAQKPKNVQFRVSFDVMNERDLKFNF